MQIAGAPRRVQAVSADLEDLVLAGVAERVGDGPGQRDPDDIFVAPRETQFSLVVAAERTERRFDLAEDRPATCQDL